MECSQSGRSDCGEFVELVVADCGAARLGLTAFLAAYGNVPNIK